MDRLLCLDYFIQPPALPVFLQNAFSKMGLGMEKRK